jgi:anti-anti-sigma factor
MEITISNEKGRVPVTVLHIKGDIDADSYDVLQTNAKQAIDGGTRYMVLDLAEVPYVSSYGIRAISQVFTWLRKASQDEDDKSVSQGVRDGSFYSHHLRLINPSPRVLHVLTETGIDMYMQIDSDLGKAVASF